MRLHDLIAVTRDIFTREFGYVPLLCVQAPGRVNLIGEHTDYNDGFVLPCAIDYQTVISCAPRSDRRVRVIAADYNGQQDSFSLNQPIDTRDDMMWSNYVRGVIKHLQQRCDGIGGIDMVISGNVPQGRDSAPPPRWRSPSAKRCRQRISCRWTASRWRSTARRRKTASSAATVASWIS